MNKTNSFLNFARPGRSRIDSAKTSGAADFLRSHHTMANLLPFVARMLALQKDCLNLLPAMFQCCDVVRFESEVLILAVPTTALATKLKQQLPNLQDQLTQRGWQVTSIRLKVQVRQESRPEPVRSSLQLPPRALQAFAELEENLPNDKGNQDLKKALRELLAKRIAKA
jgi:hypothetical protein